MIKYKHFSAQFSVCADGSFKDTEDLCTSSNIFKLLDEKFLLNIIDYIENIPYSAPRVKVRKTDLKFRILD
jgi:hypothetical protein